LTEFERLINNFYSSEIDGRDMELLSNNLPKLTNFKPQPVTESDKKISDNKISFIYPIEKLTGGMNKNIDIYYIKYLKYKQKYLQLKKLINDK